MKNNFYVVIENYIDGVSNRTVEEPVFVSNDINKVQKYVDDKENPFDWEIAYTIEELERKEYKESNIYDYIALKGAKKNIDLLASEIDNLIERHIINEKLQKKVKKNSSNISSISY